MSEHGTVFNIVLGTACNWHCPYCIQNKGEHFNHKYDAEAFCDKLLAFIEEKKITEIRRFSYWGGEPLLYQKQLEILLRRLRHLRTNKPHRTITNGSLMNDSFVQMANQYRMLINISYHEGQLQEAQWEKCLYIRNLNVTSLIHHHRLSWDEFYRKWIWIQDTFGRCVNWFVYPMLSVDGVGGDYALTKEDVDIYVRNLYSYLDKLDCTFYRKAISVLFYAFKMGDISKDYTNFCYNKENYAIDLAGNRYLCHHNCSESAHVGNIFTKTIPILSAETEHVLSRSTSEYCRNCPAFRYCRGGCYRYVGQRVYCYYRRRILEFLKYTKEHCQDAISENYLENII